MEWAHTAQVFGSTLANLQKSHARASLECDCGLDTLAAGAFLSSFYQPTIADAAAGALSSALLASGGGVTPNAQGPQAEASRLDKKGGGWRHRLVHWFTDPHSPDKDGETSYYELLHSPGAPAAFYNPLLLDYAALYYSLTPSQRNKLTQLGLDMTPEPRLPPSPPKELLNADFVRRLPLINRSFTGSKLRSLKRLLTNMTSEFQLVTLAAAWSYFEQLVLMNKLTKENRRMVFGACVSLSCKFHEDKRSTSDVLTRVTARFSRDVTWRDIAENEFPVFAALGFNLRLPERLLLPHLLTLEAANNTTPDHTSVDIQQ